MTYDLIIPKVFFLVALVSGFLIIFSLYGFWAATHPPRYKTNLAPKDFGLKFEEMALTTSDNLKIAGWYVPAEQKSDKVVILLHGYPFDKANLLGWSEFLHNDFNLFFFDFRYFGESEGSMTTVGYHEQKDLETALDYLEKKSLPAGRQGFKKIGLMGFSLGGAVALMTAASDKRIKAVVSDSAFANIDLMIDEYYRNLSVFKYPLIPLTKMWAKVMVGVGTDKISPEKSAQNLKIPVLLIHSKKDQVIPFESALRIKKSLKNNVLAQFFFFEEGGHGGVPESLEKDYQKRILEFFRENI